MGKGFSAVIVSFALFLGLITFAGCGSYPAASGNTVEEAGENRIAVETSSENTEEESTERLPDYSDYFTAANIYDYVDPDTGVHYLVFRDSSYQSGRGGITPRLNSDGTLMVEELKK